MFCVYHRQTKGGPKQYGKNRLSWMWENRIFLSCRKLPTSHDTVGLRRDRGTNWKFGQGPQKNKACRKIPRVRYDPGSCLRNPRRKGQGRSGKRVNRKIRKAGIHTWVGGCGGHPTRRPPAAFTGRGSGALFMDSQNGFLLGSGAESDRVLAVREHHP